jgi:hypothetical protein
MGAAAAGPQRAAATVAAPAPEPGRSHRRVQTALKVSNPNDAAEREAEATARAVMAMPAPAVTARARVPMLAARAPAAAPASKAKNDETSPELTAAIKSELGRGRTLPNATREFLEPRFRANFAGVRIHTDGKAENLTTRLGARAFAYGRDIFFNAGAFQPDTPEGMELIAHELTHTIQQQEVVQREVQVTQRSEPQVQRGIVSEALDWIADKANNIPGYRLFTIVIGRNPINMEKVERSGANILRALIEFIPGGHLIVEALENHGVIEKGGKFIEDQFASLGDLGAAMRDALMEFIDSLGWRDIFRLGSLWGRAKRIFSVPVDKAIDFGRNLVSGIAKLVKEAIIKPLGRWAAANIPKWDLLVAVFGKNPISDEGESPASAIIGGFMNLIGQGEIWENIKKGNAVAKAWQWFQTAMKGALSLVLSIPGRVMSTIRSLTIFDIVTLVGAFRKIVGAFASFVGDFMHWAGGTVLQLLEIIFSVVAPSVVPYLKKAGGAFSTIIKAPGRFVSTLVKAGKQGFDQFKAKFVTYLRDALFKWLLGAEGAGIYFPKSFAPIELLKLGLSVLGLTWANVRVKLVAATNETVVKTLETGFDLVKTLVTEGPAAAWEELLKTLSNLKSMVVDAAIDFVKGEVVKIAIEKLVSFLTPAGAFIQAVIAIFRTIMFVVNKLAEIGRLVAAFIDGLAALANGVVGAAANKVESVLATGLSLAISFLANFAGLGNIPKKVMALIKKIRDPVDRALDKAVTWIVAQAVKLGKFLMKGATRLLNWFKEKRSVKLGDGATHRLSFTGSEKSARLMLASVEKPVEDHLNDAIKDSSLTKKARDAAQSALKFYQANIKDISGAPIPDNPTGKLKAQIEALPANLTTLANMLLTIAGDDDLPASAGFQWGGAAGASADFLSNRTSRGGQDASSGNPKGWPLIVTRGLTKRNGNWVRMHMLSAGFGGLDIAGNLVPTPTAFNTGGSVRGFEKQVEKILYGDADVKAVRGAASLWKSLKARKGVVWVTTSTGGFWPAETDTVTGTLLYDATTFVKSVNLKGGLCFPADGAWKKDPGVLASGGGPVSKPDFSGTYVPIISEIGEPTLAKIAGISVHFAREVAANRPFTSKTNFDQKMRTNRKGESIAITPELRAAINAVIAAVDAGKLKWKA